MSNPPATPPFATLLWASLKQAGLTQAGLHRRTGIGQNRISDYVTGKVVPSWETGCLLLRACGCVVDVSVAPRYAISAREFFEEIIGASPGNEEDDASPAPGLVERARHFLEFMDDYCMEVDSDTMREFLEDVICNAIGPETRNENEIQPPPEEP